MKIKSAMTILLTLVILLTTTGARASVQNIGAQKPSQEEWSQFPGYAWHTFYGFNGVNYAEGIITDADGNSYLVGISSSSWDGPEGQLPRHAYSGGRDITVLSLDRNGSYRWHTFYGSSLEDEGWEIAADSEGNLYIVGTSYGAWNGPAGQAPLNAFGTTENAHKITALKLNSAGDYIWHTFYGLYDIAAGITVTGTGSSSSIYISSNSVSAWNGPAGEVPRHDFTPESNNIAVIKLDGNGTYQWHTFYGNFAYSASLTTSTVTGGTRVTIVGTGSLSWDGPDGIPPRHAFSGTFNIVALTLAADGAYQWHTFYPYDCYYKNSVTITSEVSGDLFIGAISCVDWKGPANQKPLHGFSSGSFNALALKLTSSGDYQWHTFQGAPSGGIGIFNIVRFTYKGQFNLALVGRSQGGWNGPDGQAPLYPSHGDSWDILVLDLDEDGTYQWHAFFGGDGVEQGFAASAGPDGRLVIAGESEASWNGPNGQSPRHGFNGSYNFVVLGLSPLLSTFLPAVQKQ